MRASRRSGGDRTENALTVALGRAQATGAEVLDLTVGNPTRVDLPYDAEEIRAALSDPAALRYEPAPFGLPSARAAIAEELAADGVDVSPDRVVLTASTSEAYGFLLKLLCDPGEEVLVPRPGYPLVDELARFEGVTPVGYRVAYDGAWHLDVASLRAAVSPRTRAIVVVSPNNPTGHYLKDDERVALRSLGLPVICDEVFLRYPHGDVRPRTALTIRDVPVFVLGGLSKLAGLPQLKLGWIAAGGPGAEIEAALARLEHVADAWLSVSTPVQVAVPRLLAAAAVTRAAIAARVADNLAALRARLDGTSATVLPVEGGWYAVVHLPAVRGEEAWALHLLEDLGVLVQPGWLYDFETEPHAVVSLLVPEATFREGIDRLAGALP
jgi:aspartate/methionine/tyrosine aminotransferase